MGDYKPKSKKKSFVLFYNNVLPALELLPDNEDLGELFRAICDYEIYDNEREDFRSPLTASLFAMIKYSLDENKGKWLLRCQQNSTNRTSGTSGTNCTDKDKEKEKDIDKEKDKDKVKDKDKEKGRADTCSDINGVMADIITNLKYKGGIV